MFLGINNTKSTLWEITVYRSWWQIFDFWLRYSVSVYLNSFFGLHVFITNFCEGGAWSMVAEQIMMKLWHPQKLQHDSPTSLSIVITHVCCFKHIFLGPFFYSPCCLILLLFFKIFLWEETGRKLEFRCFLESVGWKISHTWGFSWLLAVWLSSVNDLLT